MHGETCAVTHLKKLFHVPSKYFKVRKIDLLGCCYDNRNDGIEGVKEIWLTSEDTGTYGRDIGTSLPQLLWGLVKVIPDGCMLRIGMTNPPYILEHLKVSRFE